MMCRYFLSIKNKIAPPHPCAHINPPTPMMTFALVCKFKILFCCIINNKNEPVWIPPSLYEAGDQYTHSNNPH